MNLMTRLAAALALTLAASGAHAANVLVVLSDENHLDLKDGKVLSTGFYLNELMQPVKLLLDAGHEVTFATPQGRAPTVDASSVTPAYFGNDAAQLKVHKDLLEKLALTSPTASPVVNLARVEQQGYARFDAVYIPGGHAPMQDLLVSPALGKVLAAFHQDGKPTALVCHGPIALLSAMPDAKGFTARLAQGAAPTQPKWIYSGYKVTVFTNDEEEASKAQLGGGEMKFYPETALVKAGLKFSKAANWQGNIVTDRELITGQNPASAALVGTELLARLQK